MTGLVIKELAWTRKEAAVAYLPYYPGIWLGELRKITKFQDSQYPG
jgi:hypothetical protein